MRATLHMVNREFDALAEDFVTLGLIPPKSDRTSVVPALTGVFSDALAQVRSSPLTARPGQVPAIASTVQYASSGLSWQHGGPGNN